MYVCLLWVQGWCPFTPLPLNMAFESSSNCKCSRWSPFCSLWGIYIYSYSCLLQSLRVREKRSPVSCLIRARIWSEGSISTKYHNLSDAVVVSSTVNGHLIPPDKVLGLREPTGRQVLSMITSSCCQAANIWTTGHKSTKHTVVARDKRRQKRFFAGLALTTVVHCDWVSAPSH